MPELEVRRPSRRAESVTLYMHATYGNDRATPRLAHKGLSHVLDH